MPIDFLSVLTALEQRRVRYVLVGGLAVLMHGVDRLTADIDLVVDLAPEQASKAIDALFELGFKPHAPIDPRDFADPIIRERWRRESSVVVVSFWDPENRRPTVDLFADYSMDFELLFQDAVVMPLAFATIRVASLDHLVAIKRLRGAPRIWTMRHVCSNSRRGDRRMVMFEREESPAEFGSWRDAEALRRWSFARRSPQQRLDWLVAALTVSYEAARARQAAKAGVVRDAGTPGSGTTLLRALE